MRAKTAEDKLAVMTSLLSFRHEVAFLFMQASIRRKPKISGVSGVICF